MNSRSNQSFRGGEQTWANACVGDNGSPQIADYASGFAAAANALLEAVGADRDTSLSVDDLIYPICFNMRHAVELFLKAAAIDLEKLGAIRRAKSMRFDLNGSHDLQHIWAWVKEHANQADARFRSLIEQLDAYILDIAEIDATGQVFRYPFSTQNQKHLTEVRIINAIVLKSRFHELESLLRDLNRLGTELIDEYGWGTFTSKLSRHQLFNIAAQLPLRSRWAEESFDEVRQRLRATYDLSSNDLSKALSKIQERHEMAALLGVHVAIPHLSPELLRDFFDEWVTLHDLEAVKNPPTPRVVAPEEIGFSKLLEEHTKSKLCANRLVAANSPDAFATLRALFYFESEAPYSEAFERILGHHQREAHRYAEDPTGFRSSVIRLLEKTRALERMLYALDFLGQNECMEFLIARYDLHAVRTRLLQRSEARRRRLLAPYPTAETHASVAQVEPSSGTTPGAT